MQYGVAPEAISSFAAIQDEVWKIEKEIKRLDGRLEKNSNVGTDAACTAVKERVPVNERGLASPLPLSLREKNSDIEQIRVSIRCEQVALSRQGLHELRRHQPVGTFSTTTRLVRSKQMLV